jgi:hypothetical protein
MSKLNLKCPTWKGLAMLGELNSTTSFSGLFRPGYSFSGELSGVGSFVNSGLLPHRYL